MSPLSDTTNLAPAMAGTDVITHVKAMMLPTGITYAITLIFFGVLGVMQYHGGDADMSRVIEFSNALNAAEGGIFNISPLLLLPPVVVIVAVALKVPAIPASPSALLPVSSWASSSSPVPARLVPSSIMVRTATTSPRKHSPCSNPPCLLKRATP